MRIALRESISRYVHTVMRGLVPRLHVLLVAAQGVDGRDKGPAMMQLRFKLIGKCSNPLYRLDTVTR
jgi:hypothetical protein